MGLTIIVFIMTGPDHRCQSVRRNIPIYILEQTLSLPSLPPPLSELDKIMSIAIIIIKAVDDAVRYLKSAFWQYGTNEAKYNFTRLEFKEVS